MRSSPSASSHRELDRTEFPHTVGVRPRAGEFISQNQFIFRLEVILGLDRRLPA